jgi:ATP-dependent Zn protease
MDEGNNNNNRRNIWTYILPYFFIALTIIVIVWYALSRMSGGVVTWKESDLDEVLRVNGSATENSALVQRVSVSQGYKAVTVSGDAYEYTTKKKYSYQVVIEEDRWSSKFNVASYSTDAAGKITITTTEHESWSTIFQGAVNEWNANGGLVDTYGAASYSVGDAFKTSWWDTWGPTVVTVGLTIIIGIIFFVRLNGSVNGANKQAMDFNKSPARREDASKIRFSDVAGCDEEKAEMVEMVGYLKIRRNIPNMALALPKGVF